MIVKWCSRKDIHQFFIVGVVPVSIINQPGILLLVLFILSNQFFYLNLCIPSISLSSKLHFLLQCFDQIGPGINPPLQDSDSLNRAGPLFCCLFHQLPGQLNLIKSLLLLLFASPPLSGRTRQ